MPQAKKKKLKSQRAAVGRPLTPEVLDEMGALKDWPPKASAAPAAVRNYRIWTCHGYMKTGNEDNGWLQISGGEVKREGSTFDFRFRQQVQHSDDRLHELTAQATALLDLGSYLLVLQEWSLKSRYVDQGLGKEINDLALNISGKLDGGKIAWTNNGRRSKTAVTGLVTADWLLFDNVVGLVGKERSNRASPPLPKFSMLEGLTVLRPEQRLIYRGPEDAAIAGREIRLYHYSQIGRGVLPYEYWVDEAGRLVLAVTHSRAYILAPEAKFAETPKT